MGKISNTNMNLYKVESLTRTEITKDGRILTKKCGSKLWPIEGPRFYLGCSKVITWLN